jgi:hypothetical protein
MSKNFEIKKKILIICEGDSDKHFLENLIKNRDITLDYQISTPKELGGNADGKTQWKTIFSNIIAASKAEELEFIIVIGDNDDDYEAAFNNIKVAIKEANDIKQFYKNIPEETLKEPKIDSGKPTVFVAMMPEDKKRGNIETLCYEVAYEKAKPEIKKCIDNFATCSGFNGNDEKISSVSKLKLSSLIACKFSMDNRYPPIYNFNKLWDTREGDPTIVPLTHKKFDWVVNYLNSFAKLLSN